MTQTCIIEGCDYMQWRMQKFIGGGLISFFLLYISIFLFSFPLFSLYCRLSDSPVVGQALVLPADQGPNPGIAQKEKKNPHPLHGQKQRLPADQSPNPGIAKKTSSTPWPKAQLGPPLVADPRVRGLPILTGLGHCVRMGWGSGIFLACMKRVFFLNKIPWGGPPPPQGRVFSSIPSHVSIGAAALGGLAPPAPPLIT
jgi:hypothetical protein